MHDSAVASVSPRSRHSASTSSSIGARVAGEEVLRRAARRAPPRARRARLGAGLDEEVDVDLEVARADRRLDPVAVAARRGERLRDGRLARRRRGAARGAPAPPRARAAAAAARSRARAARARCSSRGGPGSVTATQPPAASTSAGAVPARPTTTAPSGTDACLRTPGANSAYGRRSRSATCRVHVSIRASSARVRTSGRPAARASSSTVRSSWVGPSPPEMTSRSCSSPSRSARSSSSGASPTIRTSTGSMPSESSDCARNGPLRSLRSPRTSSEPVTRIAPRGRLSRRASPSA